MLYSKIPISSETMPTKEARSTFNTQVR